MGVDCMAVYNILHVKVRTGRKSANQLDTCSRCMTHNSTTNQKSRFSVLAIGAHNASMEGRRGGPTRVEAVRPITEARWPRTPPASNHRPTRNRRVPSHLRPAISATNRRRAYIACTPCMSLPNLRFLDPHFPHAFTTRLVGWLLLVLVEVSL